MRGVPFTADEFMVGIRELFCDSVKKSNIYEYFVLLTE